MRVRGGDRPERRVSSSDGRASRRPARSVRVGKGRIGGGREVQPAEVASDGSGTVKIGCRWHKLGLPADTTPESVKD